MTALRSSAEPPMTAGPVVTARRRGPARLDALFDAGTCTPLAPDDGCAVFAALGAVEGVPVVAFATNPDVQGGSLGERECALIVAAYEKALADGRPVIGVWHSGGARLGDGVVGLHGVGQMFAVMTRASGRVAQISVVVGAAAGGAAYGVALTDVVVQARAGRIFVTGPDVVRTATGEEVDAETLGGPDVHRRHSGVAHLVVDDEESAFECARRVTALLGDQGAVDLALADERDLERLLPDAATRAYDVRPLVSELLDERGVELQGGWARSIVTTLGRLAGRTVGVVASNPLRLCGCLDAASSEKAARFVRMCDALGVPLVVVVDVPGYLPGTSQEWAGVVRRGAKLLHAFAEATVPRVTLVTRKAYGGGYIAMNSRALGATNVFAWPTARIGVMAGASAVPILHRRALASLTGPEREAMERRLAAEYDEASGDVARAIADGVVDEAIEPSATRRRLAAAIAEAPCRRGAHGNIPL